MDGQELSYGLTFGVAFGASLLAIGMLHLFLAAVPRGRMLWQLLASLFLIASIIPIVQLDSDGENKLLLLVIHIVTYLFVVPTIVGMIPRVATPAQG